MTAQEAALAAESGWLVIFIGSNISPTETSRTVIGGLGSTTQTAKPMPMAFREYVGSLATLADLLAASRKLHPDFDEQLRIARETRYRTHLNQVRKGVISRLVAERLRCGMTQKELAQKVGMDQPNISRLERPGTNMNRTTAERLAKALGVGNFRDLLP